MRYGCAVFTGGIFRSTSVLFFAVLFWRFLKTYHRVERMVFSTLQTRNIAGQIFHAACGKYCRCALPCPERSNNLRLQYQQARVNCGTWGAIGGEVPRRIFLRRRVDRHRSSGLNDSALVVLHFCFSQHGQCRGRAILCVRRGIWFVRKSGHCY